MIKLISKFENVGVTTAIYEHNVFGAHEVPPGHVECAPRYQAVAQSLAAPDFDDTIRKVPPMASREDVLRVHGVDLIDEIEASAKTTSFVQLDPDTFMGPNSYEAVMRAAGGAMAAVDEVFSDKIKNAFVAARPPGHHATPDRAMGFCFFNGAAIAAHYARLIHDTERVAVVDFDVHHGNGTEAAFWHDENAFFASSHEHPQYPGTGRKADRGAFANIVNVPLPTGTAGADFRRAWGEDILPALDAFQPGIIIISAGFDGHVADPLGGFELTEEDFSWVTSEIAGVAGSVCDGRVVSILEGGYDLDGLARSASAHVKALMTA